MDLALSLICNLLFVFFSISIFSYRKRPVLGLELPLHYVALFIAFKLIGFHYVSELSSPGSEAFSSDSYIATALLFEGGILFTKFVSIVTMNFFHLNLEPSNSLLGFSLLFDYLFFFVLSVFKRRRRSKKSALRRKPLPGSAE